MYALITRLRNYFFDKGIFKSSEFDIPIINVGNLAVGGSGKTPHTEYLVDLLRGDFRVATLSRGYGRKTRGFREVYVDSKASESGDEPLQIKRKFPDINVFVGEDRVNAVTQLLFEHPEIEVVLLDDAYQHRAIKAGLNILLTDYARIFTRDKSMPKGRLRENPSAAERSDLVVVTKSPANIPREERVQLQKEISNYTTSPVLFSEIDYEPLTAFNEGLDDLNEIENMMLVTGLANPDSMYRYLQESFNPKQVEHIKYRDHYRFTSKDVTSIVEKFNSFAPSNKILVISEKDAVRLREVAQDADFENLPIYVLPIRTKFAEQDQKIFNETIINYVRENTSYNSIY